MTEFTQFALIVSLIVGGTAAGYVARRLHTVPEEAAHAIMTGVAVVGYPVVGFLSIWQISDLTGPDLWLPGLAMVQTLLVALLAMLTAGPVAKDGQEKGLYAIASCGGNWGFTMGAFVVYVLRGPDGLGLSNIYTMMFTPAMIVIMYPIARHYTSDSRTSLARLMSNSLFDIRSIGVLTSAVAIVMALKHVPFPPVIHRLYIIDILMYLIMPVAYFSIGLRLHVNQVWPLRRMVAALAGMRFVVSLLLAWGLVWLMEQTPWPLRGLTHDVFIVQSVVPTAVSMVAVANMFNLRPREGVDAVRGQYGHVPGAGAAGGALGLRPMRNREFAQI